MINKKFNILVIIILLGIFVLNAETIFTFTKVANDKNYITDTYYNMKSIKNIKQNITKIIGDYCLFYKTNISKITCVKDFIMNSDLYNYTKTQNVILSDKLIKDGGDCKSWATFYKGIFDYMGLDNGFIHSTNHVYLNVYDETFYCNIDQLSFDCHMFGEV